MTGAIKRLVLVTALVSSGVFAADQWDIGYRTASGTGPPSTGKISELVAATPESGDLALCELSTGELRKCDIGAFPLPLIPNSAGAAPTSLGVLEYNSTSGRMVLGDGTGTKEYPHSGELATLGGTASVTGAWTFSNIVVQEAAVTAHEAALSIGAGQLTGTNWRLIYTNGSGVGTELALGGSGTVLQSNGPSSAPTWETASGSGDVVKDGTPVDNQVGVWTGDGTIEGTAGFTYSGSALDVTGNVTLSGTVDGRDVAADGTTLDSIDTGFEIETLLDSTLGHANWKLDLGTTPGTVAEGNHLHTGVYEPAGITISDISDVTGDGAALMESGDANPFTDTEQSKLANIEALADVTDAINVAAAGAYMVSGTDVAIEDGGTGASNAQDAIDALTQVSGAANESVLTKDTTTGNATWKAVTGGTGEVNTGANLGGGLANYANKSVAELQFNTFSTVDFALSANLLSLNRTATVAGNPAFAANIAGFGANGIVFEGSAADTSEGLLTWPVASSDKTITFQNATGTVYQTGGTDVSVADGGTGRSTGTTAYSLVATGTTATGPQQTLANGLTTEMLVGGGASALPVWTTATGTGAPVRGTAPQISTIELGAASDTTIARASAGNLTVEGKPIYRKGGTNPLLGPVNVSVKTAATYTVGTDDTDESNGTLFINGDNDAIAFTLPSAVAGMSACFEQGQGASAAITVIPAAGDYLVKDGVRGTIATGLVSGGTGADRLCVIARDNTDWQTRIGGGAWAQ